MENTGAFYYERGIMLFQSGQYEEAVRELIRAYDLGYEKEQIAEDIYNCFILPNEQEFRDNYAKGSAEFTQLPYESCTLDFIPVSESRFYIFDRGTREFQGLFAMAEEPVKGEKQTLDSILFTDTWDIREILPDMQQYHRGSVYILMGSQEAKFASFFKLPHFKEYYLENVIVFKNEIVMCRFFEEYAASCLPQEIISEEAVKYWNLIDRLHRKRISDFIAEESGYVPSEELLREGKAEQAYVAAKEAVRKNPYNFMANRDARAVCAAYGHYGGAVRYDTALATLHELFPDVPSVGVWSHELLGALEAQCQLAALSGEEEKASRIRGKTEYLKRHIPVSFGLNDHTYSKSPIVGTIYEDEFGIRRYNARYNAVSYEDILPDAESAFDNWVLTKLECLEATKTNTFTLDGGAECLLPVLQENLDIPYKFTAADGAEYVCRNKKAKHFEYYRLLPQTKLESEAALYIGSPVVLKQDPAKKKLVLNIFVDGLSQKVIEEEGLARLMPFTDKFFSKGVRCTNAYAAGEWTLPSIASYSTGLSTVNHMFIHNYMTNALPEVTVLAEYFKEQGYRTAKIDGDWRSHLPYGYGRGMDRVIFQYQDAGMKAAQEVEDVLDHIELMKETNQFIWMCVGDLHHIADGYALNDSVQATIPLEKRCFEEAGITSVKQKYSSQKRISYIAQMKYIDRCLETLYRYLDNNYNEDEMLISMFGDHGQGYLVREDEHFLAEGRSKVGMMFRGGTGQDGICEELISACDYLPIMCRLAGIPLKDEKIDGKLPVFFGGEQEREYVMTESIHPKDPYCAAVFTRDDAFYFTSGGPVSYDGRFELGDYRCRLQDRQGNACGDKKLWEYYFNIIMEHVGELAIV